ncbi:hypothetical protein DLAC_10417 [Tieghemostelium lacteum]|uniref:Uncharacterized protein n=1 Tax=Tieghemostelium lacteum TaxID=361077 RepID=A0A151Z5E9_TIELA|nr:hypothetical protein DLAC_10417 [Tieghemostelium lacteum]|eukprot:KYQ89171.1 hypothetical protein DLAC_10417 [Tieghemostelium lacteum]
MTAPNWLGFACETLNYLKSRYTGAIIKQDFGKFLSKVKSPQDISVADAKTVLQTTFFTVGLFYVGESVGKNQIRGFNPGYDIDVKSEVAKRN